MGERQEQKEGVMADDRWFRCRIHDIGGGIVHLEVNND